jgi:uncharacterized membrane protein YkvA (DUF1232 family)
VKTTDDDKQRLEHELSKVTAEDEIRVKGRFKKKLEAVRAALAKGGSHAVRALALNVTCLYEMLVDPDHTLPWKTKAYIVAALGYFISPFDAVPDVGPLVGLLDDALLVAYITHLLSEDVVAYRHKRRQQGRPLPDLGPGNGLEPGS